MINAIVWLIAGAGTGWLASRVMGAPAGSGTRLNLVVGMTGAFMAGLMLTPLFGINTLNESSFSLPALLVSLVGGTNLLSVVNLFLHSRLHRRRQLAHAPFLPGPQPWSRL